MNQELHTRLNQLQKVAMAVGVAGIAGAVFGALRAPHSFFVSYLFPGCSGLAFRWAASAWP